MVTLSSSVSNYIALEGKRYSYFGGNNYLGLADHPSLKTAAIKAIEKYGTNFSASRQTTGTSEIHLELEKLLAEFKNTKDSVVFASGYLGNRILLQVLADRYSAIFADEMAHPSIIDAIPAGISKVFRYRHRDTAHLEILLNKNKKYRALIITDGIFALTGEIAPLDKIHFLARKYNGTLITDDSHATGILGKNGRGTPEFFNLDGTADIFQSETMSKALGSFGGFIAADADIISSIKKESTIYLSSTSLPPSLVAAACASVRILTGQPELRSRLYINSNKIIDGVKTLDFCTFPDNTPIIPLLFSTWERAKDLSDFLKENNIVVPAVSYPVKLNKFIVRITVSAIHTNDQIEELIISLKKWRDSHGSDKD